MSTSHVLSEQEHANLSSTYEHLISSQQTLLLSTASEQAQPDISYAPYVRDQQGKFYIFISELANHTRNLLANKQASVMFIQPESESTELFARERVTIQCSVTEIALEENIYEQQLAVLKDRFGEIVTVLKSLPDFHLFALKPESGKYVLGFGKAYDIELFDKTIPK